MFDKIFVLTCSFLIFSINSQTTERSAASLGLVGSPNDVNRPTTGGTVLIGGGSDVDQAFQWMITKSGGGNFVVIRATGTAAYNDYIFGLGTVHSVETLLINSRELANDPLVERTLLNAEAVFIAGGDQANYVNFWKDTKVHNALNYLRHVKNVPIGGTSAGCAILGQIYFSALSDTVTSAQALINPYDYRVTLGYRDFLTQPHLENVITDQHFTQRDRHGRLVTFMARIIQDYGVSTRGIGVDEATAVCIDSNGNSRVYGTGSAYFFTQSSSTSKPEVCSTGVPLEWNRNKQAILYFKIKGSKAGTNFFDLTTWLPQSNTLPSYYYVQNGRLY